MRRIRIRHVTEYRYPAVVSLLPHRLLLRPREGHDIRIESSVLEISPAFQILWQRDISGNSVGHVTFSEAADRLQVMSEVVVQHYEDQPLSFAIDTSAQFLPFRYDPMEQVELIPYQLSSYPQDNTALGEWVAEIWQRGESIGTRSLLDRLNQAVVEKIEYETRETPGVQNPALTLQRSKGSCRDLATLFIEACRFCGLAARFVSGYLLSESSVQDYRTTHAWAEIYLPGAGWLGFDSTSGLATGPEHIAVAVSRRPDSLPPVSGSFVGPVAPAPEMLVEVSVALI